jgi:hypothetical protein
MKMVIHSREVKMTAHISESELKLLVYLHENVGGYGKNHHVPPPQICRDLGIDLAVLTKDGSYLEEHGLAGIEVVSHKNPLGLIDKLSVDAVYLTGLGEDYVRALENQPSIGRKLSVKVLGELGKVVTQVAREILTELVHAGLKSMHP